jgi:crotonobetainyl-CoA:carnitine CoA-transferase CaiB-like acyl-CoA transferase
MRIGGIKKCKDGGYIHLAGWRAKGIEALKERLGVEELEPEKVDAFVETMTREEAVKYFEEVGLPIAPIYYASEATVDPHVLARNMFVEVDHPKMGKIKVVNFPVKLSETPGEIVSAAPLLGQNNKEILMDYLGYTEEEVDQLRKAGVIAEST